MSATTGCDYGASTDYRLCAACGCKRPVAAMGEDGTAEKLLRCADRRWCEAEIAARHRELVADMKATAIERLLRDSLQALRQKKARAKRRPN